MLYLIDAFHPSLLQIHLGAEEVGVFTVITGHLEIDVHSVCRTHGGHWCQERVGEKSMINLSANEFIRIQSSQYWNIENVD